MKNFFYDIYVDVAIISGAFIYAQMHYKGNLWYIVGICLTCVSIIFWIVARIQLGSAFSVEPRVRPLVCTGLYAKLRHPMYLFSFFATVGVLLMLQNFYLCVILPIMAIIQIGRAKSENMLLKNAYGSMYDEYVQRMWF